MDKTKLQNVAGQPSWRIASDCVEASVTQTGGQLAPVVFDRKGQRIAPYSIAPWTDGKERVAPGTPPIVKVLRGDFFCLPFGGNETPWRGERHPVHGETANAKWRLEDLTKAAGETALHLSLKTKVRAGRVDKTIRLVDGHNAVYSRHVVSGMTGPMPLGHHAMLKFPDKPECGLISTSAIECGFTLPMPFETPAGQGYSSLKPGERFKSLQRVRTLCGDTTDLSRYPARRGFEDLVLLVRKTTGPFAWTAVSFPSEGYVWFALKDPNVLRETVLWISNGGRYYAPWNGRHVNVMGLEEVTSFFHLGLAESAKKNALSEQGFPTTLTLNAKKPTTVNYITAAAKIPRTFDRVKSITPTKDGAGVTLTAENGKQISAPIDLAFLRG